MAPIRAALVHFADDVGAGRRSRDALALAVTEAASNSIVHGYPDGNGPGEIAIEAWVVTPGHVRIVLRDDGCGIHLDSPSDGLGLGLALIAELAEELVITSSPAAGTELRMDFALSG